jgi:hypothetical protein
MKHILAENLLRFGVKNLSEANIKTLHEQNPNATAPVAKTTPKPAPQFQRFEQTFNTTNGQGRIIGFAEKQQDGSFKPKSTIDIVYPSYQGQFQIRLILRNTTYTIDDQIGVGSKITGPADNWIYSSGAPIIAPIKPLTALNKVIESISKITGTQLFLNNWTRDAFGSARTGVQKRALRVPTSNTKYLGVYRDADLFINLDPESGKEIDRDFYIGPMDLAVRVEGDKVIDAKKIYYDLSTKTAKEKFLAYNISQSDVTADVQRLYDYAKTLVK